MKNYLLYLIVFLFFLGCKNNSEEIILSNNSSLPEGFDQGASHRDQTPGEIHNDVCLFLLNNKDTINTYSTLSQQFDFIEGLIYDEFNTTISLDSMLNGDGELNVYSIQNSSGLDLEGKNLIHQILDDGKYHDWESSTTLEDWLDKFDDYKNTVDTSSTMSNKSFVRNIINVAENSSELWYIEVENDIVPPIAAFGCIWEAFWDDVGFYSDVCADDPGPSCPILAGVYSYASYNNCESNNP
jgi:hypothetical protein